MIVHYMINYGGFVGCEEEYSVEVEDDATQDEIEDAVQEDFSEQIYDNCSWTIINDDEDDWE